MITNAYSLNGKYSDYFTQNLIDKLLCGGTTIKIAATMKVKTKVEHVVKETTGGNRRFYIECSNPIAILTGGYS